MHTNTAGIIGHIESFEDDGSLHIVTELAGKENACIGQRVLMLLLTV